MHLKLLSIKETANGKLFSYLNFQYDAAGQIKNKLRAPLVNTGWQHPALTATYDNGNRLATLNGTSVIHDADGNMTSGPITSTSGNVALEYNSRNQLISTGLLNTPSRVDYSYDAEGRRRSFTDTTGLTHDTIDASGKLLIRTAPGGVKTYYVYGLGLLYEVNAADQTKTYHFDQVGSTIARTNDSGIVIGQADYSAYGLPTFKEGDMTTPFLYNGQAGVQTDPNGLLNMRARYYSPYLMRFLNADPIGFSGGSNWFAYADGNPISMSDPFGLDATSAFQLGQEWVTGSGPRSHNFVDGDPFTEELRSHSNLQEGFQNAASVAETIANGNNAKPSFEQNYSLSGVAGVPKYLNDYSTLATGGMTGNLAVTYLGSYRAQVNVTNINAQAGTANAEIIVTNSSTIASGTRPPVLGYTDWWQTNIAPAVNSYFSSGPLSPTRQTITMNQTVTFPPVQQRTPNK